MIKSTHLKPLAIALGTTLAASLATLPAANADENPFGMTKLSSGYMVAGTDKEGKCGEGKKDMEGKCGEGKTEKEGKCGEGKTEKEGKCGSGEKE
jgi:uncharacterized low-complexity protein